MKNRRRTPAPRAPLFEAVPNFSEGRSPHVVAALVEAAGPHLLDSHRDPFHHRTVLTLAGTENELRDASRALFDAALKRIDLRRHRGEHPRVGALDVLPFVPLGRSRMEDAAALATRVGAELAAAAPVFLYGHASPAGRTLPAIRRGGPEALARRMARGTMRPDFGPPRLHPTAGAVCVGARDFLIAFNVNLADADDAAARRIAARIRDRPGDPRPSLRAIGVRGGEGAQVSMNLLDHRRTSIREAFDRVARETKRLGFGIRGAEIVGLVPEGAVWAGMEDDLGLRAPPRTIEAALARAADR